MTRRDRVACWAAVGMIVLLALVCASLASEQGLDWWREYRARTYQEG